MCSWFVYFALTWILTYQSWSCTIGSYISKVHWHSRWHASMTHRENIIGSDHVCRGAVVMTILISVCNVTRRGGVSGSLVKWWWVNIYKIFSAHEVYDLTGDTALINQRMTQINVRLSLITLQWCYKNVGRGFDLVGKIREDFSKEVMT